MINVLVCDDDERFLAVLKNSVSDILRSMGIPAAVYAYSRAEDITEANYQDCDIAFLDVDFKGRHTAAWTLPAHCAGTGAKPSLSLLPTIYSLPRRAMRFRHSGTY